MPMPGGRRHCPEKSGYFDSSNARAPAAGHTSAAATASAAIALRFTIVILPVSILLGPELKARPGLEPGVQLHRIACVESRPGMARRTRTRARLYPPSASFPAEGLKGKAERPQR